jgi:tetratricopeptide (TPR) repeat protein
MDPENWAEPVTEALEINYTNAKREGLSNWREQHFEEAEGFFRLAFAALPDSLDSIKQIAGMKIQQAELASGDGDQEKARGFRNEALDMLDQVLADNPGAYRLRADKAYVLTQLDRTDEAQRIYEELLRDHADDPELLLDVVSLYSKQTRYVEAGDLFMRVADIYFNDDNPANDAKLKGMYSEAGYNYQLAEEYPRAIDAYNKANQIDVNDASLMARRVQLNLAQGTRLVTRSAQLMTEDAARAAELETEARTYLQRAVDVGNALVDIDPSNADGYYFLAQAQAALGDSAASLENMKTYNELMGIQ